jgi:hypothetical protein
VNFCDQCKPGVACPACAGQWLRVHAGNAKAIGSEWARSVIARLRGRALPPWPDYDANDKVRSVADLRMKHLAGSDPTVRDALARACAAAAREVYERERERLGTADPVADDDARPDAGQSARAN